MGLLDKLLGRPDQRPPFAQAPQAPQAFGATTRGAPARPLDSDQAVERYRYLLRTAPPEALERVHQEAFARLTPEQRAEVLRDLSSRLPAYERDAYAHANADPHTLARLATRAEVREPGLMERMLGRWGGSGGGMSFGTSILSGFVAGFAGSMIANQLFESFHGGGGGEGLLGDADGFQGAGDADGPQGTGDADGLQGDPGAEAADAGTLEADYDPSADADFADGFGDDFDV